MACKEVLDASPGHPWRLDEIGRLCGLSPNYLSTAFRKAFGIPPLHYLLQIRVERAQQYLRDTDLTITAIAGELGFASSQHFSMRFKQSTGKSPSAYRNQHP